MTDFIKQQQEEAQYKPATIVDLQNNADGKLYALVEVPQGERVELLYRSLTPEQSEVVSCVKAVPCPTHGMEDCTCVYGHNA